MEWPKFALHRNGRPWTGQGALIQGENNARRAAWWLQMRVPKEDVHIYEVYMDGTRSMLTNPQEPKSIRFRPLNMINDPKWYWRLGHKGA